MKYYIRVYDLEIHTVRLIEEGNDYSETNKKRGGTFKTQQNH